MSREYFYWPDTFPTVTTTISATTDAAGKVWRGTIPFNSLFLDHRPGQRALVGFTLNAAFGGAVGPPAGVELEMLANTRLAAFDSETFNPRLLVRPNVTVKLKIPTGTAAFNNIPLVLYVMGIASEAPLASTIVLPAQTTNSTAISVKDIQGGTVGSFWEDVTAA